jgi:hypothetical protein
VPDANTPDNVITIVLPSKWGEQVWDL